MSLPNPLPRTPRPPPGTRSLRPCPLRGRAGALVALLLAASAAVFAAPPDGGAAPGNDALARLVERAWEAYQKGDYPRAAAGFRVLAEEGVITAQTNLGYMYAVGQGVPRDLESSARWVRRAAEAGHPPAQAALGAYYYHGEGVERDPVAAWAWFALAGAGGYRMAEAYQARVGAELAPEELEQARRLADDLYTRFGVRRRWW